MNPLQEILERGLNQEIEIEVGAEGLVEGTLKNVFPEYLVVTHRQGHDQFVIMNQVRWFRFVPERKKRDLGFA